MTMTRATALVAALALVVGLAACGDDGSGVGVASLGGASSRSGKDGGGDGAGGGGRGDRADMAEFQDAMLAYAKCMRSHGVDMPDPTFDDEGHVQIEAPGPGGGKAGPAEDAFRKADDACHHIVEDAMPQVRLSPEEQAEMQDRMLAMARCMRSKGHDMPDPQVGDDGRVTIGSRGPGRGLDPEDPDVRQDMDACARKVGMPAPGRGRAGGGVVTGGKGA